MNALALKEDVKVKNMEYFFEESTGIQTENPVGMEKLKCQAKVVAAEIGKVGVSNEDEKSGAEKARELGLVK